MGNLTKILDAKDLGAACLRVVRLLSPLQPEQGGLGGNVAADAEAVPARRCATGDRQARVHGGGGAKRRRVGCRAGLTPYVLRLRPCARARKGCRRGARD